MRDPADRQDAAGGTEHRRDATSGVEHGSQVPRATTSFPSRAARYVQWATDSGALSAVTGAAMLVRSGQSLRRGDRLRALVSVVVGGLWLAIAILQRRTGRRGQRQDEPGRAGERHDAAAATDAGAAGSLTERGGPPTTGEEESPTAGGSGGTSTDAHHEGVSEEDRDDEGEKTDPEPGDTLDGGTVATEEEAVELRGVDDESDEAGGADSTGDESGTDAGTDESDGVEEENEEGEGGGIEESNEGGEDAPE